MELKGPNPRDTTQEAREGVHHTSPVGHRDTMQEAREGVHHTSPVGHRDTTQEVREGSITPHQWVIGRFSWCPKALSSKISLRFLCLMFLLEGSDELHSLALPPVSQKS